MATDFQFMITGETYHFEKQCLLPQQMAEFKCRGLYGKQNNNLEL
jgi:hypothetical protein